MTLLSGEVIEGRQTTKQTSFPSSWTRFPACPWRVLPTGGRRAPSPTSCRPVTNGLSSGPPTVPRDRGQEDTTDEGPGGGETPGRKKPSISCLSRLTTIRRTITSLGPTVENSVLTGDVTDDDSSPDGTPWPVRPGEVRHTRPTLLHSVTHHRLCVFSYILSTPRTRGDTYTCRCRPGEATRIPRAEVEDQDLSRRKRNDKNVDLCVSLFSFFHCIHRHVTFSSKRRIGLCFQQCLKEERFSCLSFMSICSKSTCTLNFGSPHALRLRRLTKFYLGDFYCANIDGQTCVRVFMGANVSCTLTITGGYPIFHWPREYEGRFLHDPFLLGHSLA